MLNPVAVADSGPLICLARIHLLGILPGLFSRILVPPEVWNEATIKGRAHPGAADISQATGISIQEPDPHLVLPLGILLDAGEAEAIALAQTTSDCIILLDDSRARKIAERLNIKQIGTIGLLLRAKRQGQIQTIKPFIEELLSEGLYIRQELVDAVLKEAEE